jgi:hypothetical protein
MPQSLEARSSGPTAAQIRRWMRTGGFFQAKRGSPEL